MSIATRIENMNNNLKNAYESLEDLGVDLENTNKNLQNLSVKIDTLYDELPQVSDEGTEITLNNTKKAKMKMILKGNTSQFSTTGVQLLDISDAVDGYFTNNAGDSTLTNTGFHTQEYIDVSNNSIMYARFEALSDIRIGRFWVQEYDENYNSLQRTRFGPYDTVFTNREIKKYTRSLLPDTKYVRLSSYSLQKLESDTYTNVTPIKDNWNSLIKVTISFTDVDIYEPYTGGQSSPNPDYPQDIHVVTGNNTISIGNTNYPINLGSLELCKIGDYQDYLYKENGNWHKKNILNKHIFSGNENISKATDVFYTNDIANNILTSGIICLCNRMKTIANTSTGSSVPVNCCCFRPGDYSRFYFNLSSITTDIDEIKQYLSNNNTYVIYPLAVPTSTQITDETLISQLNTIEKAKSSEDQTNISQINADLPFIINAIALEKNN